jgi:hypothetical protein
MNLLHFLSVSQSFSGVKETPNYRMTRGGWLPRFDAAAGSAAELALAPVVSRPRELPEAKPASASAPYAPATAPVAPPRIYRSSARAAERLRQGELSLDTVQVVRNDLSDSDFEIVRRRPSDHVVERTTSTFAAIERFGGRSGLNWLASRFFRLGRTQV